MLIDIKIRQIIEHIVGVNHIRDFTNHVAHIIAAQRPIDTAKTRRIFTLCSAVSYTHLDVYKRQGFLKWAVMAYISAFAALFIAQRPLVFGHYAFLQPAKPAWDAKLPGEKVALKTTDGETLDAWYIPPAHSGRATIVYFHGKSANIAHKQQRMAELTRDGLGLFAVDYRGFGASTGSPSQEGLSADADAAYKWMAKRPGAEKLVVFGESLGSGVAVDLSLIHI